MSEMVERVARVLCQNLGASNKSPDDFVFQDADYAVVHWTLWANTARLILARMREPTFNMERAGGQELDNASTDDVVNCWQAMIDAAIEG